MAVRCVICSALLAALGFIGPVLSGCGETDPIRQYEVAKVPAEPVDTAPKSFAKPFTAIVPESWKELPPGQFQVANYLLKQGDDELAVTVSQSGGDLAANVNRWRGQVKLPDQSPDEIAAAAKPVTLDGVEAKLFDVQGETEAILGVIAPRGRSQWFIKARGPKGIVEKERDHFDAFVKSMKFQ